MRKDVIEQLSQLNQVFYDTFAHAFSDSRSRTEPGLERILGQVSPGSRVLDLGCGQGRIALLLPEGCVYVGADFSAEMLALAQESAAAAPVDARFVQVNLTDAEWSLPDEYDWIILRAVLHHIPSYEARLHILRQAARRLSPGGKVVMANWRFLAIPRLRRRVQPWSEIGLGEEDVDPGDYLLDWQREGYGLRYVHMVDQDEAERLATDAGLAVEEHFLADGHSGDLTLYTVLYQKTPR